jgi:hypothetical protein
MCYLAKQSYGIQETCLRIFAGKCWMDALELAIHCSSLIRPIPRGDQRDVTGGDLSTSMDCSAAQDHLAETSLHLQHRMDESECEKHFRLCGVFVEISHFIAERKISVLVRKLITAYLSEMIYIFLQVYGICIISVHNYNVYS